MHEHRLARCQTPAQQQREVRGVVVEDQRRALREVELRREREREELRCDGRLGEAAERAERSHALAGLDRRALRGAEHHASDLAARNERQRRFHLVLPARLQQLREGHASRVHLDHHAGPRRQHVRGLGLRQLHERERAVWAGLLDDLDRSHRHGSIYETSTKGSGHGEGALRALRRSDRRLPAGVCARRGAEDRALLRRPEHTDARGARLHAWRARRVRVRRARVCASSWRAPATS